MLKGLYKFVKKEVSELGSEVGKDVINGVKNIDTNQISKTARKLGRQGLGTIVYGTQSLINGKPDKKYSEFMEEVGEDDYFTKY